MSEVKNIIASLALADRLLTKEQFIDSIIKLVEKNIWQEKKLNGKLNHEIGIQDGQGVGKVIRKLANRIALALLLGFMLVTSVLLIIWGGPLTTLGHTFVWSSMILSFVVAIRLFTKIDR